MLRQYLLLVRLPNTYITRSNILAGYFAVILPSYTNVSDLAILILSSLLLYLSGIVFNDYFDMEEDRKERPFRPLPSGKVTKQKAFIIAAASRPILENLTLQAIGGHLHRTSRVSG